MLHDIIYYMILEFILFYCFFFIVILISDSSLFLMNSKKYLNKYKNYKEQCYTTVNCHSGNKNDLYKIN